MSRNITSVRTATEKRGNGQVTIVRWEYKGKPRHMSTLANATTPETFEKEIRDRLEWLSGLSEFDVSGFGV